MQIAVADLPLQPRNINQLQLQASHGPCSVC
jgi:hypothetical protein